MSKKFVIYQGSGGLIHMLGGLVYTIDWCRKYKHHLIIDVKNHAFYKHKISDFFNIINFTDYSETYDIIPNNITHFSRIPLEYIMNNNAELTTGYYLQNINVGKSLENDNSVIKIYVGHGGNDRNNIVKYIKVKPEIIDIIQQNRLFKSIIIPLESDTLTIPRLTEKYIGVHFRNTDRVNNINEYINKINKYSNQTIYIATDDCTAFDRFTNANKDNTLIQFTKPYNAGGKPIHMNDPNKYELVMNILIDMYILLKADIFISSPSSLVSKLVEHMRNNTNIYELC